MPSIFVRGVETDLKKVFIINGKKKVPKQQRNGRNNQS
jgi:hypothetical protein